jgi:hypothetical protein
MAANDEGSRLLALLRDRPVVWVVPGFAGVGAQFTMALAIVLFAAESVGLESSHLAMRTLSVGITVAPVAVAMVGAGIEWRRFRSVRRTLWAWVGFTSAYVLLGCLGGVFMMFM